MVLPARTEDRLRDAAVGSPNARPTQEFRRGNVSALALDCDAAAAPPGGTESLQSRLENQRIATMHVIQRGST